MAEAEAAPLFKKKGARSGAPRQVRKRSASPSGGAGSLDEGASQSAVVFKAKRVEANPLRQGNVAFKRARTGDAASPSGDDERTDRFGESTIGTRAQPTGATAASAAQRARENATLENDWDLALEEEEAGRRPGGRKTESSGSKAKASNDDGLYHGAKAYNQFQPEVDRSMAKHKQKGPIKAAANVRTITVVDYQPDVCKDYKETGYCGFGDTCKFLHDRSDYLAGWQLDAMPNSRARGAGDDDEEEEEEEDIPFACLICRNPFTDPVVTRCGHYFCSACAIKRYSRTPKCFACGAQTGGLFNSATKLLERMEKRRATREEERTDKRRQRGEDVDEIGEGQILEGVEIGGGSEEEEE